MQELDDSNLNHDLPLTVRRDAGLGGGYTNSAFDADSRIWRVVEDLYQDGINIVSSVFKGRRRSVRDYTSDPRFKGTWLDSGRDGGDRDAGEGAAHAAHAGGLAAWSK